MTCLWLLTEVVNFSWTVQLFFNFSPNIHQDIANISLSIHQLLAFGLSLTCEYLGISWVAKNSSEKVTKRCSRYGQTFVAQCYIIFKYPPGALWVLVKLPTQHTLILYSYLENRCGIGVLLISSLVYNIGSTLYSWCLCLPASLLTRPILHTTYSAPSCCCRGSSGLLSGSKGFARSLN